MPVNKDEEGFRSAVREGVWSKSSFSAANGCCVEVRLGPGRIDVRDSKNPDGPTLSYTTQEWQAFIAGVRGGEFDL